MEHHRAKKDNFAELVIPESFERTRIDPKHRILHGLAQRSKATQSALKRLDTLQSAVLADQELKYYELVRRDAINIIIDARSRMAQTNPDTEPTPDEIYDEAKYKVDVVIGAMNVSRNDPIFVSSNPVTRYVLAPVPIRYADHRSEEYKFAAPWPCNSRRSNSRRNRGSSVPATSIDFTPPLRDDPDEQNANFEEDLEAIRWLEDGIMRDGDDGGRSRPEDQSENRDVGRR